MFLSAPTALNSHQEATRNLIVAELEKLQFEARSLGRSDYPTDLPIKEVLELAKTCSGGIILGFSQFETTTGVWKIGTGDESRQESKIAFPTPWNQLEAGVLFSLSKPLLIFRDGDVSGGVFDPGVTPLYVQEMPITPPSKEQTSVLNQVFLKWGERVRRHHYGK